MKHNPFIKTTYDGKVIFSRNGKKLTFITRNNGAICAQHVDDNLRMCCDPLNLEWYVIDVTTEERKCKVCESSLETT